jgi:sulfur carrier protein|tara:strand:- start:324 stop:536 length:213 start_codon:yes stop_codon:yes gene_type:complete
VNAKTIGIILNGSEILLKSNSLKELVDSLNLQEARFAVEINREIVPKSQIDNYTLNDKDVVEIVIAVGGG